MNRFTTQAYVLNRKKITVNDCYLTLFTRGMGIREVYVSGGNNPKNPLNKGAQPFVFGEYTLRGKKSLQLREVEIIESFYQVREKSSLLVFFTFMSQIISKSIPEGLSQQHVFEQMMNTLYIAYKKSASSSKALEFFLIFLSRELGFLPRIQENDLGKFLSIDGEVLEEKTGMSFPIDEAFLYESLGIIEFMKRLKRGADPTFMLRYIGYHQGVDLIKIHKDILNMYPLEEEK